MRHVAILVVPQKRYHEYIARRISKARSTFSFVIFEAHYLGDRKYRGPSLYLEWMIEPSNFWTAT
jgi:hypothetical protein